MADSVVPSLISAASGLLGVVVGSAIPWLRERFSGRKQARYLAIRIVCILDKFAEECVDVVKDDGLCEGRPNFDGCLEPQAKRPDFPPFPEDVDWRSIRHDLMYRILSLPREIEIADRSIGAAWSISGPPNYEEFFEERAYQYARVGSEAAALARGLRRRYGIPERELGTWNPAKILQEEKDAIERRRSAAENQPWLCEASFSPASVEQSESKTL